MANDVKVYTVNGAAAGSSSSLPDWLTRKRASTSKSKRLTREHVEGTIELIQGFDFPEASNRIKTTQDGYHIIATGTYKPQMRVWDLDQLSLKFERHTDAENIDFVMLSDDWTKSIHLQSDRTIELHTQGGFHYRTRIPRFGRSLAYHFPSCDAYFCASGNEVYRLNLDQGRFMTPLTLKEEHDATDIPGVNVIDINPAHQLLAFGIEENGTVQFWDSRSRSGIGTLRLPKNQLSGPGSSTETGLSVTAISSRRDGLSYAVGTSSGHTLLYDIRSARPYAIKDQGYGLPLKSVIWIEGGSKMAGDGMVISADQKVVKIWDRQSPSANFASITPANDINDLHHVPGSGLLMTANEGIQMATYYIPQLGPAPRWASFLENITEEMEAQTMRSVYEDFKFVERSELKTLGLDHLVGTPMLKPYMHGYFISLKLYDTARLIANPFAYAEHREKMVKDKMDKMAETRIRTKRDMGVKVNKALAEKLLQGEERAKKREEKKRMAAVPGVATEADGIEEETRKTERSSLLTDPRFSQMFENPEFAIDENSREYALLNPSSVAQTRTGPGRRTAVEDEENDEISSDDFGDSGEDEKYVDSSNESMSDVEEPSEFHFHKVPNHKNGRLRNVYEGTQNGTPAMDRPLNINLVPMRTQDDDSRDNREATFGRRRTLKNRKTQHSDWDASKPKPDVRFTEEGDMEMSWVPSSAGPDDIDDMLVTAGGPPKKANSNRQTGVESFGVGLEKGWEQKPLVSEIDRKGRAQRRRNVRSGSKNTFRRM